MVELQSGVTPTREKTLFYNPNVQFDLYIKNDSLVSGLPRRFVSNRKAVLDFLEASTCLLAGAMSVGIKMIKSCLVSENGISSEIPVIQSANVLAPALELK